MKIHIDTFVTKGYSHYMCEDYATHIDTENYCAVIISDGCSSSENTDVGSSIIALNARKHIDFLYKTLDSQEFRKTTDPLKLFSDRTSFARLVASKSLSITEIMGLNSEALDATLLIVLYDKKRDQISYFQFGDGNWITEYVKTGVENYHLIEWTETEYQNNRPYYPSYHNDPQRLEQYLNICEKELHESGMEHAFKAKIHSIKSPLNGIHEGENSIVTGVNNINGVVNNEVTIQEGGNTVENSYYVNIQKRNTQHIDVDINGSETPLDFDTIIKEKTTQITTKSVLIASDGLTTFVKKENGQTVEYDRLKLIEKIMNFKGYKGQFLHRRMKRVLKEIREEGFDNFDDISIGIIRLEEE